LPASVTTHKQHLPDNKCNNPYEAGTLSVVCALLNDDESGMNRKLRSAAKSGRVY